MAHAGLWLLAGVLLGSVTGAATATFIAPQPQAAPQEGTAEFAGRVAESLELAVTRAVDRARAEASAAWPAESGEPGDGATIVHADLGPTRPATRRRAAAATPADAAGDDPERDAGTFVRDGSTPLAAKETGRLDRLIVRTPEAIEARRREWMFIGERALVAGLGTPDEIVPGEDGTETWSYRIAFQDANGVQDETDVCFQISRSRVIQIYGAEFD